LRHADVRGDAHRANHGIAKQRLAQSHILISPVNSETAQEQHRQWIGHIPLYGLWRGFADDRSGGQANLEADV